MRRKMFLFTCGWLNLCLHAAFDFENGPRDICTEIVTKVVPVRAMNYQPDHSAQNFGANTCCGGGIFRDRGQLLGLENRPRDINTEIVTEIVSVRAVDLSIPHIGRQWTYYVAIFHTLAEVSP